MLIEKLGRKIGIGLIGLGLAVNLGARITESYQNRPRIVTLSEFYYDSLSSHKRNSYDYIKYASYALGISGAALALGGKRIRIRINVNRE